MNSIMQEKSSDVVSNNFRINVEPQFGGGRNHILQTRLNVLLFIQRIYIAHLNSGHYFFFFNSSFNVIRIESWLFFLSHNNRIHPCIGIMHAHTTCVSMCMTNNNKKSYATTYHREISTMSAGECWGVGV